MSADNDDIFMNDGPKNPWGAPGGKPGSNRGGRGSSSGSRNGGSDRERKNYGGGGRGPNGPDFDIDDFLRRARNNLGDGFKFGGGLIVIGLLVVLGLWMASGIYRVQPGEHAVIKRFGAYNRTQTDPGLGFHLPSPIESVKTVNVALVRKIHIGFDEGGTSRFSGGKTGARDIPEESLMLTADANIVDIDVTIQWNIADASKYFFNIRDQIDTLKKSSESALREVVGQTNLQPLITQKREQAAERIRNVLQEMMDDYGSGIAIKEVLIQDATVHPDVTAAFEDVVAALQDAEKFQNEATIYRNDIIPKARGQAIKMMQQAEAYKQSEIAKATGDAKRFDEVRQAYLKGKDVTRERIFIETMEEVFKNAQKIIVDQEKGSAGVLPYLPLGNSMNGGGASSSSPAAPNIRYNSMNNR